jgi:hypothetical protein
VCRGASCNSHAYLDGEEWVEVAESEHLVAMMQLAGLLCQHATEEISSVQILENGGATGSDVWFAWSPAPQSAHWWDQPHPSAAQIE